MEEKLIRGKDYCLPYFEFGNGNKSFILFPGASMTSILDSEEGVKALFAPFTEDYRIYVFDVPKNLDMVSGIDHLSDIMADAIESLGIKDADVYGSSMGGMIAQKLAIRHSHLVRTLSLASSMSRNNSMSRSVVSGWLEISDPKELAKNLNSHVYSQEYYNRFSEAFRAQESNASSEGVKRLHSLAGMILSFSSYDELENIKCPVFVYAGSCDNTLGVDASIEIAEKTGCRIKVFEGYSHAVYDEFAGFYDLVFKQIKNC